MDRFRDIFFGVKRVGNLAVCGWMGLGMMQLMACSGGPWNYELPASSTLGSPRGNRLSRAILHLHSPYSYDACDYGKNSSSCLEDLRRALCQNHIDFAFLTDHPSNMVSYEFGELVLQQTGDTVTLLGGVPVLNQMGGCSDGHVPAVLVGFESNLMALGMEKHGGATADVRRTLYEGSVAATVTQLKADTGAIVTVPHSEKWSVDDLQALNVDGIEVYNFHANLDGKIRKAYLGQDYFGAMINLLPYIYDPFKSEQPDLAFVSFFSISSVYFQLWDSLLGRGQKPLGFVASDSHQNISAQKTWDNERMDAHRRLLRWASNHVLTNDLTFSGIKTALQQRSSWIVFEALGSPVGMDFYVDAGGTIAGVGGAVTWVTGNTTLHVSIPRLHSSSPQGDASPTIKLRLKKVLGDSGSEVVAETTGTSLAYSVPSIGVYRAEVVMIPYHLQEFLSYDDQKASQEFTWIVTNPIFIE